MEKQEFDAFISKKGLKLTRERDEIVSEVLCCQGHFAPDELFVQLRSKGSKVSRASIYRTIPLLVESGLIAEVRGRTSMRITRRSRRTLTTTT